MSDTTVVLVEDHTVVREGIATLIDDAQGLQVVGQAEDVTAGVSVISETKPTIAVVDLGLPDGSGIDLCRRVRQNPDPPAVLILSATGQLELLQSAFDAGATGYMLKRANRRALEQAIRDVASGQTVIEPSLAAHLFSLVKNESVLPEPLSHLQRAELEVLLELAEGRTTNEIAQHLFISKGTLHNRVSKILRATRLRSRTEAALLAVEHRDEIKRHLHSSER